jgi:rhodanese-related sulfurtransferase
MTDSISNIDVDDALNAIRSGALVLDVREDDEWSAGRINGAVHIRLSELPDRYDELDRSRTVLCVCRVGGRSARAAHFLTSEGFRTLNLDGGMTAWSMASQPLLSDNGEPRVI